MVASSSTSDSDRQRSGFCSSSPRGRTGPPSSTLGPRVAICSVFCSVRRVVFRAGGVIDAVPVHRALCASPGPATGWLGGGYREGRSRRCLSRRRVAIDLRRRQAGLRYSILRHFAGPARSQAAPQGLAESLQPAPALEEAFQPVFRTKGGVGLVLGGGKAERRDLVRFGQRENCLDVHSDLLPGREL